MLEVIEPPAAEPVTLPEVYDHLRLGVGLTSHPDDARLTRLIRSARAQIESITRRALIQQTIRWTLEDRGGDWWRSSSRWGSWGMTELPRPVLLSVEAMQYFDEANVLRSIDVASYRVIGLRAAMGGRIEFVNGFSLPSAYPRSDAHSIVYTAGYPPGEGGETSDDDLRANVPEPIRDAVLLLVDLAYNVRLPAEEQAFMNRIDSMLETYRIPMS